MVGTNRYQGGFLTSFKFRTTNVRLLRNEIVQYNTSTYLLQFAAANSGLHFHAAYLIRVCAIPCLSVVFVHCGVQFFCFDWDPKIVCGSQPNPMSALDAA